MKTLAMALALLAGPVSAQTWQPVQNAMTDGRWAPSAVVLADGHTALIAGGYSYAKKKCVASADLFDEATRTFRPSHGTLNAGRDFATASLLPDGRVLIAGGFSHRAGSLDTAELYDPKADAFYPLTSRMACGRELSQATTLKDGKILLTGGLDLWTGRTQDSAELFDPKTLAFTHLAAPLAQDRFGHAAVRLSDGRVLLAGGQQWLTGHDAPSPLASAELYDPRTGRFRATRHPLLVPRDRPTASLLPDGRVLIAGGQNGKECPSFTELFDPKTEAFTRLPSPLTTPRMAHSEVTQAGGAVWLVGGWSVPLGATTSSVEVYDPSSRTFHAGPALPTAAHDLALLRFPDGAIIAAGGKDVEAGQERSLDTGALLAAPPKTP